MADVKLNLLLTGIAESISEIKGFTKAAEKQFDSLDKSLGFLKKGFAALGVGITFKAVVSSAIEADDAVQKLNNALILSGDTSAKSSKAFQNLATEIELLTGASDEAVLAQVTYLKTLGATDQETKKLIQAAANLSTVTDKDLGTSVQSLVGSLAGQAKELGKNFKELKQYTPAQLQAGAAVEFFTKKIAGLAEANRDNLGVQLKVTKELFGDLLESIGRFVTQSGLAGFIASVNNGLKELIAALDSIREGNLNTLAQTIVRLASAVTSLFIISKIPTLFFAASSAVEFFTLNLSILQARTGLTFFQNLIVAIKGVTAAIFSANTAINLLKASATIGLTLIIDQFIKAQLEAKSFSDGVKIFFLRIGIALDNVAIGILKTIEFILEGFSKIPKVGNLVTGALDGIRSSLSAVNKDIEKSNKSISSLKQPTHDVGEEAEFADKRAKGLFGTIKDGKKDSAALESSIRSLAEALGKVGLREDQQIQGELAQRNKLIEEGLKQGKLTDKEAAEFRQKAFEDSEIKLLKFRKKENERFSKGQLVVDGQLQAPKTFEQSISFGVSGVSEILKGAQGAANLVSNVITQVAEVLLPGIGGVIGEIFNVFAQGPEKVREMITGFFDALPTILENIILAIPEVITALIESIPRVIDNIISAIPRIIDAFVAKIPDLITALAVQMPFIAQRLSTELAIRAPIIAVQFAVAFVKEVPNMVKEMVSAFVNEIKGAFDFLGIGGGGGDGGGLLSDIGGFFGFASGGTFSGGIPFRDSIPAMVQRDETIITDELTRKLDSFLNEQGNRNNGSSQPTTVILQVGEEQLARVMLNLNRQNFRTA